MSDELSTQRLAALRTRRVALDADVRRLESQQSLLEKQVEAKSTAALEKRLEEVSAAFSAASEELERVTEELELTESARTEHDETTDQLERLVDSFNAAAGELPELAELLAAMKLCLGALATSRRLERSHESLSEPKDISRALSEALLRLASTMSTRAQVLRTLK